MARQNGIVSWSSTDVRILLAGMSNMLSNIVSAVIGQLPDSVVAGRAEEPNDLLSEVRQANADVVILQDAHPDNADSFAVLWRSFPSLLVVAITADGSSGYLHELRPCSTYLEELSAGVLQAALQGDHGRMMN